MLMHFLVTNILLIFSLVVIAIMTYLTGECILFSAYKSDTKYKIHHPEKYWKLTYFIGIVSAAESSYLFHLKLPISLSFCAASIMFWCGSVLVNPTILFTNRKNVTDQQITEKRVVSGAWLLTSFAFGIFLVISKIVEFWYR